MKHKKVTKRFLSFPQFTCLHRLKNNQSKLIVVQECFFWILVQLRGNKCFQLFNEKIINKRWNSQKATKVLFVFEYESNFPVKA